MTSKNDSYFVKWLFSSTAEGFQLTKLDVLPEQLYSVSSKEKSTEQMETKNFKLVHISVSPTTSYNQVLNLTGQMTMAARARWQTM